MMSRRLLLTAAPLVSIAPRASAAAAQDAPECGAGDPFGLLGPEDDAEFGQLITGMPWSGQTVGSSPARHTDVARAFRLLFDAPRKDPLDTARYFAGLSAPGMPRGSTGQAFNVEWKGLANPLIVNFFALTFTKPSEQVGVQLDAKGDQTYWCAAFVSFCLYATGRKSAFTAMSGGYRRYGTKAFDPVPGDIAVFEKRGEDGRRGSGHVGFFLSETSTHVTVLGGNQSSDGPDMVNERVFPKEGKTLRLRDIRRPVKV